MNTRRNQTTRRPAVALESLEDRQLMAGEPWGSQAKLNGQDVAAANYATLTGAGTSIVIIDTGVDYMHPDLGGGFGPGHKVVAGYDFVDNDADPMDADGHGTGVAGMAAGLPFVFNGQKFQGIAPGANIIALRIDPGNYNWTKEAPNAILALQWVHDSITAGNPYNIVAVNMSFGKGHFTVESDDGDLKDQIAALAADGVFMTNSSGIDGLQNGIPGIEYPGSDPNVYSIGATFGQQFSDGTTTFAAGSMWLPSLTESHSTERGPNMDLLAPGAYITLPYYDAATHTAVHITGGYGTSFAAPQAAAMAAILKQLDPTLTPAEMMSIMKRSGSPLYDPTTDLTFSRLNVANAIALTYTERASIVTPGANGSTNGIAYDAAGVLHLAYYDEVTNNLKYASRSAAGIWTSAVVVDPGFVAGQYVSLTMDPLDHPGIAYYDANNADLKYAHFNGTSWDVMTVDATFTTGYYPSLCYDAAGRPVITYYAKTGGNLRFAQYTSAGAWALSTIDSGGDVGRYSSLALDPATGRWAVAYEDDSTPAFKYAAQTKGGGWAITTVDATTQYAGGYISLAFNPRTKLASFSYYDAYNANLKYALFNGSSWSIQTVASKGTVGLYSNVLIDAAGNTDILYYNRGTDGMCRASLGSGGVWSLEQVTTDGGRWISRAIKKTGSQTWAYAGATGIKFLDE